ncbi:MAG: prepilin-type N-terminal cleavage/methylation domain-containing protein [Phycisphaerales bacterium]|nr:prepilin-type N-terminal cleavage/methylation domain-containing protein [Phycisphaerales bacterium]
MTTGEVNKRRSDEATKRRRARTGVLQRGFTLMEVLLSIMILGVGVISIAALFPAGIVQQRISVDEGVGPMVANNALSILRSKLRPEHFGTLEQFGASSVTVSGDWFWSRPAFYYTQATVGSAEVHPGDINIFGTIATQSTSINSEIPWNRILYPDSSSGPNPPAIVIKQGERHYPMAPILAGDDNTFGTADDHMDDQAKRPQYVWDCMFRRFQGKILVAIFVYRVNIPGGPSAPAYAVVEQPTGPFQPGSGVFPPMPFRQFLGPAQTYAAWVTNKGSATDPIAGNPANVYYNAADPNQAWQESRQWIMDQNNCIHRVLGSMREGPNQPQTVQLVRPVPGMPDIPAYYFDAGGNAVDRIWYLPLQVNLDVDGDGIGEADAVATVTPVYATVKEL